MPEPWRPIESRLQFGISLSHGVREAQLLANAREEVVSGGQNPPAQDGGRSPTVGCR